MHYGAMTLQDYDQVMALCAGQVGVLIRDADSPEHFARYLRRNPGLSSVARNGEALAGCILCGHDGRRGYLNHLVVDERHRRLGIGRRLAELALAGLEKDGIYKCHLFILPDNLEAKAFWRRLGWIESETELHSFHIGGRLIPRSVDNDP